MSEHLPECPMAKWLSGPLRPDCICTPLRACRARTLDEALAAVDSVGTTKRIEGGEVELIRREWAELAIDNLRGTQ